MKKLMVFAVVLAMTSTAIATAPSPGWNDSCAGVDCIQGNCVSNGDLSLSLPYTCQCYSGWSTIAGVAPSLPCNVPNCTLNSNCSPVASPASSATPITSANTSSCLIPGICGHGKCEVMSVENSVVATFKCACDEGYANVLNITAGFCVNHCEMNGRSCQNLNMSKAGSGSTPSNPYRAPGSTPTTPYRPPNQTPATGYIPSDSNSTGCKSISFHGGFYAVVVVAIGWSSLA